MTNTGATNAGNGTTCVTAALPRFTGDPWSAGRVEVRRIDLLAGDGE